MSQRVTNVNLRLYLKDIKHTTYIGYNYNSAKCLDKLRLLLQ